MTVGIIDLGIGNINSVAKALKSLAVDVQISSNLDELTEVSHFILPGVGSFAAASKALLAKGGAPALDALIGCKPLLGICVGMQLFARNGVEHGINPGLGWVDADVVQLPTQLPLPHVGWNDVNLKPGCPLFNNMPAQPCFYFTHSFGFTGMAAENVAASCEYGAVFIAAISVGRRYAVQFHPEKSQQMGLLLLNNFLQLG